MISVSRNKDREMYQVEEIFISWKFSINWNSVKCYKKDSFGFLQLICLFVKPEKRARSLKEKNSHQYLTAST